MLVTRCQPSCLFGHSIAQQGIGVYYFTMIRPTKKMLSPRQWAARIDRPYITVMQWIQRGLVEGVEKLDLPDGRYVYQVPESARVPEVKREKRPAQKK